MKNILITGANGFIGSHLVEKLIVCGNHVVCIDDLSTGFVHNLPENDLLELKNGWYPTFVYQPIYY